jgi:uncharacterized repeat protein (TIGR03803 family)
MAIEMEPSSDRFAILKIDNRIHIFARLRTCNPFGACLLALMIWGSHFRTPAAPRYYTQIKSFGFPSKAGVYPRGKPCLTRDWFIVGITSGATPTMFRANLDGSGYSVIHSFSNASGIVDSPRSPLTEGADGILFGAGWTGGFPISGGMIYSIRADGTGYEILHQLASDFGFKPVLGRDGKIYGTTPDGGSNSRGTLYRMNPDGSDYIVLHDFDSVSGLGPVGFPVEDSEGNFYGATAAGGKLNGGIIYKVHRDGGNFQAIFDFPDDDVPLGMPKFELLLASNGKLYGVTQAGGTNRNRNGTVYTLSVDGTDLSILHNFDRLPLSGLIEGPNGVIYGVDEFRLFQVDLTGANFSWIADLSEESMQYAQPGLAVSDKDMVYGLGPGGSAGTGVLYKKQAGEPMEALHSFTLYGGDGGQPIGPPISSAGQLVFGICSTGGKYGNGTVFAMSEGGDDYHLLHDFSKQEIYGSPANLIEAGDSLYGFTREIDLGRGMLFSISKNGQAFSVLASFEDGYPVSLIRGSDLQLYVTLICPSDNDCARIYKMNSRTASRSLVYEFNGSLPDELVEARDGAFYGIRVSRRDRWRAEIFRLSKDGMLTSLRELSEFPQPSNNPLIQTSDGLLYGVLRQADQPPLIFFKIGTDASSYVSVPFSGSLPSGRFLEDTDGVFYYTNTEGIYRINKSGLALGDAKGFGPYPLGSTPTGGLVLSSSGSILGATAQGGDLNGGTIYRLGPLKDPAYISIDPRKYYPIHVTGPIGTRFRLQHAYALYPGAWMESLPYTIMPGGTDLPYTFSERPVFFRAKLEEF